MALNCADASGRLDLLDTRDRHRSQCMYYNDIGILEEFLASKQHTVGQILARRDCANATTPSYLYASPGGPGQIGSDCLIVNAKMKELP